MSIKHKSVGSELTQAEFEASDSHEGLNASHTEPTRAIDTIYQNTSGKLRLITVTVTCLNADYAYLEIGSTTPPATKVAQVGNTGAGRVDGSLSAIIPVNWYFRLVTSAGTPNILEWHEWDLS